MRTDFLTGTWPLIGRAEEIAGLIGLLERPRPSAVLLLGEAGVGKTALTREVVERAASGGAYVLTAAGGESTREVPFLAVADWIPRGMDPADVPTRMPEAVRRAADGRPVVLGVDDADHLDGASASLVADLVEEGGAAALLTARSPAPATDALDLLRRRVSVRAVDVGPLGEAAFAELLGTVLDGPVDGLTTGALWRMAAGNPLFLRHLLGAGAETGGLHRTRGVWSWRGPVREHPRLRDLVATAVGVLTDEHTRALEYVAHAGSVPLTAVESLVGPRVLSGLVERSLVTVAPESTGACVRLAHPLYGEVVRAGTGPLRRRRIHRDLADAVDRCGGAPDPIRPVLWRLQAGADVPAERLVDAAYAALRHGDPPLAQRLVAGVDTPAAVRVHGEALVAQGMAAEAEELLAARGGPAALRALNLFWGLREPGRARAVLGQGAGDGPEFDVAATALALFTHGESPAEHIVPSALDVTDGGSWLVDNAAAPLRAYTLTFRGRPGRVTEEFDRGVIRLPRAWGSMRGATEACQVYAMVMAGALNRALTTAERYYREAVERGDQAEVALVAFIHGVALCWAGRPAQALPLLREAHALVNDRTLFPVEAYIVTEYASCAATLGRTDLAFRELSRAGRGLPDGSSVRDHLRKGEVRAQASAGRFALAADLADRLADRYLAGGRLTTAVESAYLCCRLRPGTAAADRLRRAVDACDSPLFTLFARHGSALATRNLPELAAVGEELATLGYNALALEAVLAARGPADARRACELDRRAEELAALCSGPRPPWLAERGTGEELTSREREVAELAASGMGNPAIAGYLGISVRTVSNHLQRAYGKLDISRRAELGGALALPARSART